MKTIGDRLNIFDNGDNQTVGEFNKLFPEVPLTGYNDSDSVAIGWITANATTRMIVVNNLPKEHSLLPNSQSELAYLNEEEKEDEYEWMNCDI